MQEEIENLTEQIAEQAGQRRGARLLMTHPGVGPVTALATDVFLGDPQRFADGKALASYVGLIPREYSSGARQRFGAITTEKAVRYCAFSATRRESKHDVRVCLEEPTPEKSSCNGRPC